jgi:hypothetical protein
MATKAELLAWRNKGFEDGEKGRPVSPSLAGQPAAVRSAYFEGRRCAEREVARA